MATDTWQQSFSEWPTRGPFSSSQPGLLGHTQSGIATSPFISACLTESHVTVKMAILNNIEILKKYENVFHSKSKCFAKKIWKCISQQIQMLCKWELYDIIIDKYSSLLKNLIHACMF